MPESIPCPVCGQSDAVRCKDDPRFYRDGRMLARCFHGNSHPNGGPVNFFVETGEVASKVELSPAESLYLTAQAGGARNHGGAFLAEKCGIYLITAADVALSSSPVPTEKWMRDWESRKVPVTVAPLYKDAALAGLEVRAMEEKATPRPGEGASKTDATRRTVGSAGVYVSRINLQPQVVIVFAGIWDAVSATLDALQNDECDRYAFASVPDGFNANDLRTTLETLFPGVPRLIISDQDPSGQKARARFARAGTMAILPGTGLAKDYREADPKKRWKALMEGVERALDNQADPPEEKGSQATVALDLAWKVGAESWVDPAGVPHLTVPREGHLEHYRLKADPETPAGRWLASLYYRSKKKALPSSAKKDVLENLIADALSGDKVYPTARRVARFEGKVYLDLCSPSWEVVEISSAGYRIRQAKDVPVRFTRAPAMLALPQPTHGKKVGDLASFFHCVEDDFRLIVVWILAALSGGREYPILVFQGEAGSSKSTATALARALIDPNKAPLRKIPKEERDLFIAANNGFVLTMDNLSTPPDWLPDALCALALDTGYACRALYTDDEETVFQVAAPCILNGITDQLTRSDLADRALCVTLHRIPPETMRPKDELNADFQVAMPGILGAFLDVLAQALKRLPQIKLSRLPRMAQTAKLVAAAEPALGWAPGTFAHLFQLSQESVAAAATEGDPLARALEILADRKAGYWTFEGSATELQEALDTVRPTPMPSTWPPPVNKVGERIRRLAPQLRLVGWEVNPDRREGGKKNGKVILLRSPKAVEITPSDGSQSVPDGSSDGSKMAQDLTSDGSDGSDGRSLDFALSPLGDVI